jgi:xylulokinase
VERKYVSDWHNALKLGYDVRSLEYPEWLLSCLTSIGIPTQVLPSVVAPGERIQTISHEMIKRHGFPEHTVIVGGTTDSNAAFIAAAAGIGGIPSYGMAVTSLGSTLAIKMLSRTFVEDSDRGVYSLRFPTLSRHEDGNDNDDSFTSASTNLSISNYTSPAQVDAGEELWLVGGASNVG